MRMYNVRLKLFNYFSHCKKSAYIIKNIYTALYIFYLLQLQAGILLQQIKCILLIFFFFSMKNKNFKIWLQVICKRDSVYGLSANYQPVDEYE